MLLVASLISRNSSATLRKASVSAFISNQTVRCFSSTAVRYAQAVVEHRGESKEPIPTVLLSGFLGSGKTTTLKHLLENASNTKIGAIVNDVAAVNIDSKLISNAGSKDSGAEGVVQLANGCACCSIAEGLFSSIETLAEKRNLDCIVVELSGVADPMAVSANWNLAHQSGHPATRIANLKRTITLVDASTFATDWMSRDIAADREGWVDGTEGRCAQESNVPKLLVEQIEAADLLLINKSDLAGQEQTQVASGVAKGLNKKANIMETEFGQIDANDLFGNILQGKAHTETPEEETCGSCCSDDHSHKDDTLNNEHTHGHTHEHTHGHKGTDTASLGITSFVYKKASPFDSKRLLALLGSWPVPIKGKLDFGDPEWSIHPSNKENVFGGVLRSKGFIWMAPSMWGSSQGCDNFLHETVMYLSHAGKHLGITMAGKWWGHPSKAKEYFFDDADEYERIMQEDWLSEEWGDRRQELVFIGVNLKEETIRRELDACLCTEEEMESYKEMVERHFGTPSESG